MAIFEQLEPRILLSADIIPLPADTDVADIEVLQDDLSLSANQADPPLAESADATPAETEDSQHSDLEAEDLTISEAAEEEATSEEIIFINDDVEGAAELAEGLEESTDSRVIILNSSKEGVSQVTAALENVETTAIHLFTHGTEGNVKIGSTWISQNSIDAYRDDISTWGNSLTEDGDILFYGCDLAAGEEGQALVDEIAELTGADVAASSDATGTAIKGGDWILEYETGEIETAVAVSPALQEDWVHILAEEYVADSFDTGDYSGSDGSVGWTGDWIEIGEDDGESSGNVRIEEGRLYIQAADNDEALRGIYRVADLSDANTAYLTYDYEGTNTGWFSEVSFEIREDSGSEWASLKEYWFYPSSGTSRFDISNYISDSTEIRFVSEGSDSDGGLSYANADYYVDNLRIDYTTDTWSSALWLSTSGDVDEGGQDNVDTWASSDMIGLNNSNPTLGTTTDGEFSIAAQLSAFADGANIDGLHYVTTTMLIGESEYQLEKGDILFVSSDATSSSFGSIDASGSDVILFRPGSEGDYSSGTFSILFDDLTTRNVTGITLVESGVTIGDRALSTGDLLFTSDDNKIYHFATTDVELSGSTSGVESILLDGDDADVSITSQMNAIDLIERTVTIGSTELEKGTLLLSTTESGDVGSNTRTVSGNDIFALEVTSTSSADGSTADLGIASASYFLDGSDVSFNTETENIDALSLTVQGEISGPVFTGAYFDADERTITLTGENLDYLGEIGENVKTRIDWTKIVWDVNGDGDTTENIDFELENVSTVLASETTLVIHLTGQKTSEITGTENYGAEGGMDTITILPGFSSNESGDVATTDGLSGAVIYTTTGPTGITLSQLALDENTDTSGGTVVGTLSSTDPDSGESFTYTITGGADAEFFSISGDELIIDAGVLDFETKSSYVVTITTTDSSDQSLTENFTISVSDINETPEITNNNLTISEGGTVTLTGANLSAEDPESADGSLTFTVTALSGGYFSHADTGITTEFSQSDISLGKISFIHDGGEDEPSYIITVSDGSSTSAASGGDITFSNSNDAAEIITNSLTVSEGERVTLTSTDLEIVDPDTDPGELIFTVAAVSGGQFELASDAGNSISSFTLAQVNSGEVEYAHNGGETDAGYTLSLDDKGITVGPSIADITFIDVNDAPILQQNSFIVSQDAIFTVTAAQLLAIDTDDTSAGLTFTISNVDNCEFEVAGVEQYTFTQEDINAGNVVFYHTGGSYGPSFEIEVSDGELTTSSPANVVFNTVNQAPVFQYANLTISEGDTVTLSSDNFYTTDTDTANSELVYTITSCDGGYFEVASNPGVAITSFTQLTINEGDVRFVHDGDETAPSFGVTVSDGQYTESPAESNIDFTNINDTPVITAKTLTITEGGEVTLDDTNLSATDPDDLDETLKFIVTEISGGNFYLQGTETVVDEFTRAQVDAGEIVFIHDGGEDAPELKVKVSDGEQSSAPETAMINFTATNDAPVLVNNSFTVTEGGSVVLDTSDISATDIDSVDANLSFTVTAAEGGYFAYSLAPTVSIDSFTQAEIQDGDIVFVHNGSETQPTYQITVTDDAIDAKSSAPESGSVTLTPVNDAPEFSQNALTISEGETLQLNSTMLGASDSDSDQVELSYTVSDLVAGIFVHEDDMENPITHFSQIDLSSGKIYIIHDGSETPLACTITVSDGKASSPPSPTTVTFNPVNDTPTIINRATDQTFFEDSPRLLSGITLDDIDGGTTYEVTLELSDIGAGVLSEGSEGTASSTFSGTTLTITGTDIDDVNGLLASTVFTPAADYEGDITITMNATDGLNPSETSSRILHAITNNDAPTATHLMQNGTYTENLVYDIEDIVVSDVDSDETITATMTLASPDHGTLTTTGGGSYDDVSGVWTISGSFNEVNNALAAVSFVPADDSAEDTSISVVIEDGGEDGVAPLTGTISLTGTSVADVPVINTDNGTTEEGDGYSGENPSTGEAITGEEIIEQVVDTPEETLLEQIDVVDTNTNVPTTTTDPVEETAPEKNSESEEQESQNDTEPEVENVADTSSTYINAQTVSNPDDDTNIAIFANFDKLSSDLSLGNTRIESFSFSTNLAANSQDTNSSARLSDDATPEPAFKTSDYSLIDLEFRERSFEEYQSVRQSLDIFKEETENENTAERTVIGSAIAASTGLSAGYVIWLLRSGALLSSLLSSIPAWQLTDPLAVLGSTKGAIDEDDDSLESIIEKGAEQPVTNGISIDGKDNISQQPDE